MAQPDPPMPDPPMPDPPMPNPPPAPRGGRLAWVLAIVCGLLVAAGGVGGTIFASHLSGWNRTIADQQRQIEALKVTDRSQRNDLENRETLLSDARRRELMEKAKDNEANRCRRAVSTFLQSPINDTAKVAEALARAFTDCRVVI